MEVIKKAVGIMPELFADDTVLHLMTETSLVADLAHHLDKMLSYDQSKTCDATMKTLANALSDSMVLLDEQEEDMEAARGRVLPVMMKVTQSYADHDYDVLSGD